MIPKISSGNNYSGLLNYLEDKENKIDSQENGLISIAGSQRIYAENFSLDKNISLITDRQVLAEDFDLWDKMSKNKSFENKVGHFSLSFAQEDKLDKEKIIIVAKDFMEKMGYKNNPVAIYQHHDKHHTHIHIITSRVGEDGKKINDSNEIRRAITICRELEIRHNLFQVIKGESIGKLLNEISDKTITASADLPFKNTIIQNLQYYLNYEKVTDLMTLQKMLRLHKIEMVLHDKEGNRLPQNGVRFYFKNGNKVISYLGGKNFDKHFIPNLEARLLANKNGIKYVRNIEENSKEFIPTHKPNYKIQKEIGTILYNVIQESIKSIIISPDDLIKSLEKHKIIPEFKTDKNGNLIGLSFIVNNIRYKSSDFEINGVR